MAPIVRGRSPSHSGLHSANVSSRIPLVSFQIALGLRTDRAEYLTRSISAINSHLEGNDARGMISDSFASCLQRLEKWVNALRGSPPKCIRCQDLKRNAAASRARERNMLQKLFREKTVRSNGIALNGYNKVAIGQQGIYECVINSSDIWRASSGRYFDLLMDDTSHEEAVNEARAILQDYTIHSSIAIALSLWNCAILRELELPRHPTWNFPSCLLSRMNLGQGVT